MEEPADAGLPAALLELAAWLQEQGYRFTTVTPATHARVNARPSARLAHDLRGVFGWSRPFRPELLPRPVFDLLRDAGLLHEAPGALVRSAVRFSTLRGQLFAHSAYPTEREDAVFFGPDTYRFARLIEDELRWEALPAGARILDLGCGSGAGGIVAAALGENTDLTLSDINPRALFYAAANAALAGRGQARLVESDLYAATPGPFDLILANPPYLNDAARRTYRHGGGRFGEALSARIVREGLPRLSPGGRLVLYTGAAMVEGHDPLLALLRPHLQASGWPWRYREIDPDVFGEELDEPAYQEAERIAAVSLVVQRPGPAVP
jgi:methylase of polypeptide subunit release factors